MSTYKVATDETLAIIAAQLTGNPAARLDGTAEAYKKVMRQWFIEQGIDTVSPDADTLTALCDKWYALTREAWDGYVEFYQTDVSSVSTGTKGGDNADMTCTPSTDTVEGSDDYAGLPLFACVDCNWEMAADDDGVIQIMITAIDGITSNFKRTDTGTFVGVLQQSGYLWWEEDTDTYRVGYSAFATGHDDCRPLAEAVKPDGTFREWVCHGKYSGNVVDSKLTCCSGQPVRGFVSHANTLTYKTNIGSAYSGFTVADRSFVMIMAMIKYGTLALETSLLGCVNNSYQYYALVAEEGVNRVLVSSAAASYLEVGENMLIGNYGSTTDRGSLHGISGTAGAKITAIETETVDDTDYCAVYFDDIDAFDTGAEGSATEGTTYISTYHWDTGMTDRVYGNDGAPTSCTSGKYPMKLQGIEIMNGAYEDCVDVLWYYYADDDGTYVGEPYTVSTSASQASSIASYTATGAILEQSSADGWRYIKKNGDYDGILLPEELAGSSSTYTRDALYFKGASATGTCAFKAFGHLSTGSNAGLSCVIANVAASSAYWGYAGRLSPNGNRGAWSA